MGAKPKAGSKNGQSQKVSVPVLKQSLKLYGRNQESLLQAHQKKLEAEQEKQTGPKMRVAFDRERDMQVSFCALLNLSIKDCDLIFLHRARLWTMRSARPC